VYGSADAINAPVGRPAGSGRAEAWGCPAKLAAIAAAQWLAMFQNRSTRRLVNGFR